MKHICSAQMTCVVMVMTLDTTQMMTTAMTISVTPRLDLDALIRSSFPL